MKYCSCMHPYQLLLVSLGRPRIGEYRTSHREHRTCGHPPPGHYSTSIRFYVYLHHPNITYCITQRHTVTCRLFGRRLNCLNVVRHLFKIETMTIRSKMLFILIGDDSTGKTTLQKFLIEKLCGKIYERLPTNAGLDITHPDIKRKYCRISFGNRSYQEKKGVYGTIDEYFQNHFNDCDITFISSHLIPNDIAEMIRNGHQRFFNVFGVFLSNSLENKRDLNSQISIFDWDERFLIENPLVDQSNIEKQLEIVAESFVDLLTSRTNMS